MARIPNTNVVVCDGCGVEITWAPVVVKQRLYCCQDCVAGRPCQCDYPPEEELLPAPAAPALTTS